LVKITGYDGVTVDFEYMSDALRILNADMLLMFEEMKKADWGEVSVDVFANTIIKGDAERLTKLANIVDGVIIMAYDFHRPGSDFAGAVAPMGAPEGERSIEEILRRLAVDNIPKEKFIMAYPLYGYQWETVTGEKNSATMANGYGTTVLYKEGVGFTRGIFDEEAKSPWYAWAELEKKLRVTSYKYKNKIYKKNIYYYVDQWHSAYIENEESLKIKINAVKQAKLGGTGFWALGYEGKTNLIEKLNPACRQAGI
jgi:spore germination protein YaaH